MAKPETLCLETSVVNSCLKFGQIVSFDFVDSLLMTKGVWVPRDYAETNENFQQIIPYIAVYHTLSGKFMWYRRKTKDSEKRLQGMIAFPGGHIEWHDRRASTIIGNTIDRELDEEVTQACKLGRFPYGSVLFKRETPVDMVHTGILTLVCDHNIHHHKESDEYGYASLEELAAFPDLEGWCRLALDLLPDLVRGLGEFLSFKPVSKSN